MAGHGGRAKEITEIIAIVCMPLWRDTKVYSLVENMRASDVLYAEWVLHIGNGTEPTNEGKIEIPQQCIYSKEEMVHHLFSDMLPLYSQHMEESKDLVLKRVILTPTNRETHQLNEEILAALDGRVPCTTVWTRLITMKETPTSTFQWNI